MELEHFVSVCPSVLLLGRFSGGLFLQFSFPWPWNVQPSSASATSTFARCLLTSGLDGCRHVLCRRPGAHHGRQILGHPGHIFLPSSLKVSRIENAYYFVQRRGLNFPIHAEYLVKRFSSSRDIHDTIGCVEGRLAIGRPETGDAKLIACGMRLNANSCVLESA